MVDYGVFGKPDDAEWLFWDFLPVKNRLMLTSGLVALALLYVSRAVGLW